MSALPGHSRRALVAATAALAAAPAVEAKKKKRKRKKKPPAPTPPPPPLATALMTVSSVNPTGDVVFDCVMAGAWKHLASEEGAALSVSVFVPMESTGDAVQAFLVTALQGVVSLELANNALDVPPERITVTLI